MCAAIIYRGGWRVDFFKPLMNSNIPITLCHYAIVVADPPKHLQRSNERKKVRPKYYEFEC